MAITMEKNINNNDVSCKFIILIHYIYIYIYTHIYDVTVHNNT